MELLQLLEGLCQVELLLALLPSAQVGEMQSAPSEDPSPQLSKGSAAWSEDSSTRGQFLLNPSSVHPSLFFLQVS